MLTTQKVPRLRPWLLLSAVLISQLGCTPLRYYGQAVGGHVAIMASAVPVERVIQQPSTEEPLRSKLALTQQALDFAIQTLHLPDNGSYRHYVDLRRPYSTWNVVATEPFSLEPKPWCFWLVGCLDYRGYYAKADAEKKAALLTEQGFDVALWPSSAYSTLGYLRDPILSSMLRYDNLHIVGTLFHELAHQQLYLKQDSQFNESFASFVEQEGVRRWLDHTGEAATFEHWQARQRRKHDFLTLLAGTRAKLSELYASALSPASKRAEKARLFQALKDDYAELSQTRWSGSTAYRGWFERPLNNAHLAGVSTYNRYVPGFQALLDQLDGDLVAFYQAAASISRLSAPERERALLPSSP